MATSSLSSASAQLNAQLNPIKVSLKKIETKLKTETKLNKPKNLIDPLASLITKTASLILFLNIQAYPDKSINFFMNYLNTGCGANDPDCAGMINSIISQVGGNTLKTHNAIVLIPAGVLVADLFSKFSRPYIKLFLQGATWPADKMATVITHKCKALLHSFANPKGIN